jgi:hypothetical protein
MSNGLNLRLDKSTRRSGRASNSAVVLPNLLQVPENLPPATLMSNSVTPAAVPFADVSNAAYLNRAMMRHLFGILRKSYYLTFQKRTKDILLLKKAFHCLVKNRELSRNSFGAQTVLCGRVRLQKPTMTTEIQTEPMGKDVEIVYCNWPGPPSSSRFGNNWEKHPRWSQGKDLDFLHYLVNWTHSEVVLKGNLTVLMYTKGVAFLHGKS